MLDDFDIGPQCDEQYDETVVVEEYIDYSNYDDFDDYWYDQNKHLMCTKCDFPHTFFEDCVEN